MRSLIPKVLWVILVDLAHDLPGSPRFVFRRWHLQNIDDLLLPLVSVDDIVFDIVRAIFDDRAVAGVKLSVLGLSSYKGIVVGVHFLETCHVLSKILKYGRSVAEDGVRREESFVEWEVDSDGVGGVTRREEEVEGSEVSVHDITLANGYR